MRATLFVLSLLVVVTVGCNEDENVPSDGAAPDAPSRDAPASDDASPDGGEPAGAWWQRFFTGGASAHMRRPWNVGFTFYTEPNVPTWSDRMGAPADVQAGQLIGPNGTRANTWALVCGGDLSATTEGVLAGSQPDLRASDHLRYWVEQAPVDTWAILAMTTVPWNWHPAGGSFVDGWQQVARGDYDAWYHALGQRLRWYIDHSTNKDYRSIVLRPNWEMNQDTGFMPNFFQNGGYVRLYNRMMKHFADSFRAGYGYDVPIIFGPAATPTCLPLAQGDTGCTAQYDDFFEFDGVYQLADVSHHPAKTVADTTAEIHDDLYGRAGHPRFTLVGDVIRVARAHGLAISAAEWSPRWEAPPLSTLDYFPALPDQAVDAFADVLEQNQDIVAFTCAHNIRFITPDLWMTADPMVKGPAWRRAVERHRARFGHP